MDGVYCRLLERYENGCIRIYEVTLSRLDVKLNVSRRNKFKCDTVQVVSHVIGQLTVRGTTSKNEQIINKNIVRKHSQDNHYFSQMGSS